ncbi:hypothetical protein DPMN_059597 [Dreissena polymorpha]|uniref:Uncharacterized protein n=1 Tax=Dreissena polymorpha TaxID=45954 RepID=A0A9D4C4A1_DREPO|nr:hypothetical protein DPMN_059597 [Dreissena polymorpha]
MARQRPTRLVMGPCIAEIDRIVIREVHHQLEVNWCRNEEVIGAPGLVIVPCIRVQYQFEVNRCRNEEIIVKGNFGWVYVYVGGAPQGWLMGPCIVEIDCIVIREVQYNSVNRAILGGVVYVGAFMCIVEIDPNVIREVQYQFKSQESKL